MNIIIYIMLLALSPPTGIRAHDAPNDGGGVMLLEWQVSTDDGQIDGYEIQRSENGADFEKIGFIGPGRNSLDDETKDNKNYYYRVAAVKDTIRAFSEISAAAISRAQWIDLNKTNIFIGLILFSGIIIYFISQARKKGKDL